MNFLNRIISLTLVFASSVIAGCASPIAPESLRRPSAAATVTVQKDFTYMPTLYTYGLAAGLYVAEFEDDEGVFYRGPARCFREQMPASDRVFSGEGGIWIAKGPQPTYRPYLYLYSGGSHNGSPQDAQAIVIAATPIPPNATPVQAGVGTALGLVIAEPLLSSLHESRKGKIKLFPTLPADQAALISRQ
jgi:hypothetical protein